MLQLQIGMRDSRPFISQLNQSDTLCTFVGGDINASKQ